MVACSMGFQVLGARKRPLTSPGKPSLRVEPKPRSSSIFHMTSGWKVRAILAAPMLDDFWITWATDRAPWGGASEIVAVPMVMRPGAQLTMVEGENLPVSRARAAVKGFMVE